MTLFDACRIMAEWSVKIFIPIFEFQEGLFPPFSNPAGWVADWLGSDGGLNTLAWFYAVNIAFAIGMTNLILVSIWKERLQPGSRIAEGQCYLSDHLEN